MSQLGVIYRVGAKSRLRDDHCDFTLSFYGLLVGTCVLSFTRIRETEWDRQRGESQNRGVRRRAMPYARVAQHKRLRHLDVTHGNAAKPDAGGGEDPGALG